MIAQQTSNINNQSKNLIYIMYGALILFLLYKQVKSYMIKRNIKGNNIFKFRKELSKLLYILGSVIILFGIVNIYAGQYISGALMIVLVLLLVVDSFDGIWISEEGIYSQGTYLLWPEVKKWGFDTGTKELVMSYRKKEEMQDKTLYIKVNKQDIEEVNRLIRKYKLGK